MPHTLDELESYLSVLEAHGSLTPRVLKPLDPNAELQPIRNLEMVTVPEELAAYFRRVDGCDVSACDDLDLFEPQLAWGMSPLSVETSVKRYNDLAGCGGEENPDYWPLGFVPIMWDGGGSYLCVNCLQSSPTFGAVYDMEDSVGCNRVANSLSEFFSACSSEVTSGLRKYDLDESEIVVGPKEYLELASPLFGNSPYFARVGKMGSQIVDWK